ncbi:hypothetical protein T01_12047 [Trichinella spiralis]|uniref:Uncharacterized protein n=1 Tax=Trichinella spiralis TaxID=6334 RepID=A0A0V1AUU6_TRISP|nr:hypothetical protein T01_12047 [Trichinella spiralis]
MAGIKSVSKSQTNFAGLKLGAKFFRFGMEHFKYPAIHGQIFPNSYTISDGAAAHCPVAGKRGYFRARRLYIVCRAWSHVGKCAAVSKLMEELLASSLIFPSPVSYLLRPAVSTRQAAGDGKMREGLPGSFPHAHLNG